jgi:hypothetical protein
MIENRTLISSNYDSLRVENLTVIVGYCCQRKPGDSYPASWSGQRKCLAPAIDHVPHNLTSPTDPALLERDDGGRAFTLTPAREPP